MAGLLRKYKLSKILDIELTEEEINVCKYLQIIFTDLTIQLTRHTTYYYLGDNKLIFGHNPSNNDWNVDYEFLRDIEKKFPNINIKDILEDFIEEVFDIKTNVK